MLRLELMSTHQQSTIQVPVMEADGTLGATVLEHQAPCSVSRIAKSSLNMKDADLRNRDVFQSTCAYQLPSYGPLWLDTVTPVNQPCLHRLWAASDSSSVARNTSLCAGNGPIRWFQLPRPSAGLPSECVPQQCDGNWHGNSIAPAVESVNGFQSHPIKLVTHDAVAAVTGLDDVLSAATSDRRLDWRESALRQLAVEWLSSGRHGVKILISYMSVNGDTLESHSFHSFAPFPGVLRQLCPAAVNLNQKTSQCP